MSAELRGAYFDGHRSQSHDVVLTFADGRVRVTGTEVARDEPFAELTFSDPVGRTPRFIRFRDGAFCEVADGPALDNALAVAIHGPSHIHQWESSWRWVGLSIVVIAIAAFLGYRYGLPFAAGVVANRLPASALDVVSDQTLAAFDGQLMTPTKLSTERQESIRAAFARLAVPDDVRSRLQLEFRHSEAIGANALALPSGTIVVTDGLVELAKNDEEIVGVLAHEVGHIDRRHSVRNLIQSSIVTGVITMVVGDISALAAAAPAVLLNARYSREFEREADAYALTMLRSSGIDASSLANILERMEAEHGGGSAGALAYVSSHPPTAERLDFIRGDSR